MKRQRCEYCGKGHQTAETRRRCAADAIRDADKRRDAERRIYGEGKPGARPCLWPDEEAPFDWDDPPVCRRPAKFLVSYNPDPERGGVPTCGACLDSRNLRAAARVEDIGNG
jgi:hypothetical protein